MAEHVHTGGMMSFKYGKNHPKIDKEYKEDIDEAYERYYERKNKEKRNRTILYAIIALIILLISVFFILKYK